MPDSLPTVAVVIVTYNSREDIGRCLGSLVGGTGPFETTVVVVDNQSADGTVDRVRKGWAGVQVIEAGGNLGFSHANNLGIRATASDYVLFLNPDTALQSGAFQTLVRSLAARADAAVAGPRLVDAGGQPELSWGPAISPWGEFRQKTLATLYRRGMPGAVRHVDRLSRQDRDVVWVSGACLLARRRDVEAVGLFDERFFMYTEDVDLCVAMRRRGRRVIYVAGAHVIHARGRSAAQNPDTDRMRRKSHVAYYDKHHPAWAWLLRAYLRVTGQPFTD